MPTTTRDPKQRSNTKRYVKTVGLIVTLGGLPFDYNTGVVSGALPLIANDLALTP